MQNTAAAADGTVGYRANCAARSVATLYNKDNVEAAAK
jgi:hypothetical protein